MIELHGLTSWIQAELGKGEQTDQTDQLLDTIREHLQAAHKAARGGDGGWGARAKLWTRFKSSFGGSSFERTLGHLDAVEADLLRLAPSDYVYGLLPSIQAHVNRHLPKDDPRWEGLTAVVKTVKREGELSKSERGVAVAAFHAANSQRRREFIRLRSFRNMLVVATVLLLMVAAGLGTLGSIRSDLIPLCFNPAEKVVCPTQEASTMTKTGTPRDIDEVVKETVSPWDLWLVELVGLVAAAVASAVALRGIRGASTPISLPVALAALKLATGALTAFLGLLLMRGGFVPGLSALDTSAQILSWAIVFGYSQQLFTRFIDQQANTAAQGIHGRGAGGDRQITRPTRTA